MTKFLNETTETFFGRNRTTCIEKNVCVTCGNKAHTFRDALSIKEFTISGMCQDCQDKVFGKSEVE